MEQKAVTISIPADLLEQARQFRDGSESFDEMVAHAIAQEVRRRKALAAQARIAARSAQVEAKTGLQPSSTELIRQLREGEEQRAHIQKLKP